MSIPLCFFVLPHFDVKDIFQAQNWKNGSILKEIDESCIWKSLSSCPYMVDTTKQIDCRIYFFVFLNIAFEQYFAL